MQSIDVSRFECVAGLFQICEGCGGYGFWAFPGEGHHDCRPCRGTGLTPTMEGRQMLGRHWVHMARYLSDNHVVVRPGSRAAEAREALGHLGSSGYIKVLPKEER